MRDSSGGAGVFAHKVWRRGHQKLVLGLLLAVFLALPARAAIYYVDQNSGNDAGNGSSPASAWKNAPGMSAYAGSGRLSPGDVVYFDRADTWLVTGSQGIHLVGGVSYIGDEWGSGTGRATIRANADLDAGVARFRDHATYRTILKGFDLDANGKVATGVDINSRYYAGPMTGAMKVIQNVIVRRVWSRVSLGQYKYGIHVSNHGGAQGVVENVEIIDTVVHDVSRDAIALYPGDESADCWIRNVTVRGSRAYNTGQDPDYCCGAGIIVKGFVQNAVIENNYVHDTKGAAMFVNGNETHHYAGSGQINIHIRNNIFTNATANGAILIYDGASGGDPKDIKIYGNIVYNSTVNAGLLVHNGLRNSISLLVYNNTFYNAPVVVENSSATFNAFDFKNNILHYSGGTPLRDAGGKIRSHANNIYFRSSGTLVSSGGASYTANTLVSYEPTASSSDPALKNPANLPTGFAGSYGTTLAPNADGLSTQPGSPAVDRGAALAVAYAVSINSVARPAGSAWDIGAYELGGGAPLAAPANLRIVPQ